MRATTVSRCRIQYSYAESICDYGFKWRACELLQKNKDTWYRMLWYLRYQIRFSPEIVKFFKGRWHRWRSIYFCVIRTATDMCCICTGTVTSGAGTTTGLTTTGMPTTRLPCSQLSLFLSCFGRRVFFFLFIHFPIPASQILAYFMQQF